MKDKANILKTDRQVTIVNPQQMGYMELIIGFHILYI